LLVELNAGNPPAGRRGKHCAILAIAMSTDPVVLRVAEAFPSGDAVASFKDEDRRRAGLEMLREHTSPDFVCTMAGPGGFSADYPGPEGFFEAWDDWLAPFESLNVDIEDMIDAGEHCVFLVRQKAVPKGTTATVDNAGAAVLTVRSGKLSRIEFHLDRGEAMRSAGLQPSGAPGRPDLG
jgi:ketosteroid isomerase-like protein